MATRDVSLLAQALERRHNIPEGTSWVNYVRSHDDIGWTFADEEAAELGINGFDHRRFLNAFYVNRFPGSLAHGVPLLYFGDEVGQLNDYDYAVEDGHAADSRWVHRPHFPAARYARRTDPSTPGGAVFAGLRTMITVRSRTPELAGTKLLDFATGIPGIIGYQRPGNKTLILALANFSDLARTVPALALSGFATYALNVLTGDRVGLEHGIVLQPLQFVWLRVTPVS